MTKQVNYRAINKTITVEEFLKLEENEAIKFDFFRIGGEPDECLLATQIYKMLYPWYDIDNHRGDTMNTYRKAIFYIYRKYYVLMSPVDQEEILSILRTNTKYIEGQLLFEYERTYTDENQLFNQISNNYQLGNFCVFPRGKINAARSYNKYNDYFDRYLEEVKNYYDGNLENETKLQIQIKECEDFFKIFNNFNDYIEKNYFQDYLDEDGSIIELFKPKIDDFNTYTAKVNVIIQKRGKRIYEALKI